MHEIEIEVPNASTERKVRETVEVRAPGNFKVAWRTNTRGKALQWWGDRLADRAGAWRHAGDVHDDRNI